MRKYFRLLLLSWSAAVGWSQSAPPPAPSSTGNIVPPNADTPLTLAQVLDLAHRANPTLLSATQHLAAVHAQEITAGLRQNPSAVLSGQMVTLGPDNSSGPDFYSAGMQRLFERGNKRQLRLENARSTTALAGYQLDDQRRQIDLAVRQAFSRMLYAQAAVAISRENLEGYRKQWH